MSYGAKKSVTSAAAALLDALRGALESAPGNY
jgi:hypothetical protein